MKEAQRELTRAVADANEQAAPAAEHDLAEQNLAVHEAAPARRGRADGRHPRAVLVADRQLEQEVRDALDAEACELLGDGGPDAR